MKIRYRGLELIPGSAVYPILEKLYDWIEWNERANPPIAEELLGLLRDLGFCFCTTVYGCVACNGGKMPRNEFEQNIPFNQDDNGVPLTLGVGGPVVGTAKVTEDGTVIGEITDETLRKKLQGNLTSFAIGRTPMETPERAYLPDPADRYRAVGLQQDEMGYRVRPRVNDRNEIDLNIERR
jgi:hypothetical protein